MNQKRKYAEALIPPSLVEQLGRFAERAEADGTLTAEQLAIIYDHRWFKLFVPRSLGGLELSLPDGVRLEEELARIDGSLGWTVTLCAGANLFVGFIERSVGESIFIDPYVCLGGSGQATGSAITEGDGYRVSGQWRYATGAPHLTHFTANCVTPHGVRSFFFPRQDVQIITDWEAFGLTATASHSFAVDRLRVDPAQAFVIAPHTATWNLPVYRYPFLQFAEVTLAANTLGMARHFLACCAAHLAEKTQGAGTAAFDHALLRAEQRLETSRSLFYRTLYTSWNDLVQYDNIPDVRLQAVSVSARALVGIARQAVVELYPYCGMAAAQPASELNRIWRDLFTASQHSVFRPH